MWNRRLGGVRQGFSQLQYLFQNRAGPLWVDRRRNALSDKPKSGSVQDSGEHLGGRLALAALIDVHHRTRDPRAPSEFGLRQVGRRSSSCDRQMCVRRHCHMLAEKLTKYTANGAAIVSQPMATFEELDALSSQELHARAAERARKHLDVSYYWELMKVLPAAEAAIGNEDQSTADIFKIGSLMRDFFEAEGGDDHIDALRPFFIDYLLKHQG